MKKVLVANRGEIAVRIIRACHDLGLQTVAVYSEADSEALHVLHADEAICIGEAPSTKSYLKISNILSACEITGADAIHPGYGFLSENSNFASICESCGLTFVGPSAQTIALLGDKSKAKETAKKVKCPVIPGSDGVIFDLKTALGEAKTIGYPLFIKAAHGGGGKGIRIARDQEEFLRQFPAARTEAEVSFGNPDVYLEKMIVNPRHVEVQVLGDKEGNYLYLGERDCTIQRRRQKLIEETPSPVVSASLRKRLSEAAVAIAKEAGYFSAATVEFLLDEELNFYFMEVNTRIQVEHTVTEELTGVDLVQEQLRIARGERLRIKQKEISFDGHVMQFRINAENPAKNFSPSPGRLEYFIQPGGPHVRVDSACYSGYQIPPHYDSMIAKLIVKGKSREEAIQIGKRALSEFHIGGIETTIPFHLYMLEEENFLKSSYFITSIDQLILEGCTFEPRAAFH
ncbi:MAG: acetyl-CoA carboxylase biotin carboxylase subunit [Chlamydiae bacterium GWC2_50_10]|nr:MAG: acetyl-CoA carboxylase biotin carboxylase subunit [Chlamydiae bacterium GWA2_50_15]OGN54605.1 MAG: acetyl-CoA carboxylase biotin carboxylase subunit [Chlamydiae bacterium GWC2_50_10]OGN56026.1 MAG: acetyl-CoA carboxylase biotin carboxylase subunit [Chlamydiae bacterium GWF2_49_8]OGN57860.1 MAG: acetyl-CoA carboxylase biotin carboxylase subunit [Chlamydiae bacterium RIFCSPHIGHO2_02_FULL_49_29]OGN63327.1 MAG: acetyl-CoA carboxylase biotin carboxylase subunit [Chlamydiae bacterium RIFCSPHI